MLHPVSQNFGDILVDGNKNRIGYFTGKDDVDTWFEQELGNTAMWAPLPMCFEQSLYQPNAMELLFAEEDFKKCLEMKSQTLLIEGRPGVGKSHIMHGLVDKITNDECFVIGDGEKQRPTVASYHFNWQQRLSIRNVLLIILRQISNQHEEESKEYILKLKADFGKPSLRNQRIAGAITEVIKAVASNTCIFLDALDECPDDTRLDIMGHLFTIQERTGIGLIITGRGGCFDTLDHEPVIRKTLEADDDDIGDWIEAAHTREQKVSGSKRPWLARVNFTKIRKEIRRTSKGIFLLARLNFNFICDARSQAEVDDKLKIVKETFEESNKNGYQSEYTSVFEPILRETIDRIFSYISTSDKTTASSILGFVRDAIRPFSEAELTLLLRIEVLEELIRGDSESESELESDDDHSQSFSSDGETYLPGRLKVELNDELSWSAKEDLCLGLIQLDERGQVNFLHPVVLAYFKLPSVLNNIPSQQNDMARRCIAYSMRVACHRSLFPDKESLTARLSDQLLLGYSSRYWAEHLKNYEKELDKENIPHNYKTRVSVHALALKFLQNARSVEAATQIAMFRDDLFNLEPLEKTQPHVEAKTWVLKLQSGNMDDFVRPWEANATTGLHIACRYSFLTLTEKLLDKSSIRKCVNQVTSTGSSPLLDAALQHNQPICNLLLEKGAKADIANQDGVTPLMVVQDDKIASLLIKNGGNIEARTSLRHQCRTTELQFTESGGGNLELSPLLYTRATVSHRTALHYASRNNHSGVLNELLKHNPNKGDRGSKNPLLNARDTDGQTAFHKAAKKGNLECIKALEKSYPFVETCETTIDPRSSKANKPGRKSNNTTQLDTVHRISCPLGRCDHEERGCGGTALHLACKYHEERPGDSTEGSTVEVVKWLLENAAPIVNSRDHMGRTPLHLAVQYGATTKWKILNTIIALGKRSKCHVEYDAADNNGQTPLHIAAVARSFLAVDKQPFTKLCKVKGISLTKQNVEGRTPLHEAVIAGRLEVANELLNRGKGGVDIGANLADYYGKTALFYAAKAAALNKSAIFRRLLGDTSVERQLKIGREREMTFEEELEEEGFGSSQEILSVINDCGRGVSS
ncbi:hypothetical protein FSARC_3790 [Fusarium sarcochroum]|uniref:AAA+ ATPase domain-containing protein n=1 Tax=Fusarium sarcochroum TaxID=1208366 RepID=A0A8H4U328_9HYPO|nr:hypothetical protein FSARC_3790 [Fusarium sarcochroum]